MCSSFISSLKNRLNSYDLDNKSRRELLETKIDYTFDKLKAYNKNDECFLNEIENEMYTKVAGYSDDDIAKYWDSDFMLILAVPSTILNGILNKDHNLFKKCIVDICKGEIK